MIFEISTGCFLWRRINRWTGCRDHSTVTYWSSVDKALPFNSNWQESWLLNRESSSFLPPWQLHGRVWGIETLPNVKPRYIITELPQFWRQQAVTTVFCHQILFSDKYRQSIDKYRQLCGAAKYSVFRLTRSRFNVATPTSSFLSSIIAFLIHQIKTIDFFGRQKA